MQIATFLELHGFQVSYPGLQSHPQYELHARMSSGPGAVLSFTTGDTSVSERVVESTKLWAISVSFGCVNSLIRYIYVPSEPPFYYVSGWFTRLSAYRIMSFCLQYAMQNVPCKHSGCCAWRARFSGRPHPTLRWNRGKFTALFNVIKEKPAHRTF